VPYVRNSAANLPLLSNYDEKPTKNEINTEVQRHSQSVSPRPLNECDSFKGTVQLRKVEITRRFVLCFGSIFRAKCAFAGTNKMKTPTVPLRLIKILNSSNPVTLAVPDQRPLTL